ncbi:ketoacyl-ACP synthase III [Leptospira noguchii]|uniref:Beta-ketoacyl-acyl-carrier-protein synthase III n=2 Tax=Leptospira noguchii TaxID=28182 RepID=M6UF99_9LEPT|nr:ketoacyl-ACP synthase III [Leptospira noguchii]EKR73000.1 beta-ketoacyl-acyl-carrier-protein synthase III [Leptospira noguchii str. 2006001870]EMI68206.1 beta-ketoacyl-acyl-carrier-protein synthase III [Leptospira noguchii str. Bonito]EMO43225.1 beta-ketoacyl-acyl-carrier-protein synthase III [Leptospira noguchii serovar Autumnalis str. ZUN142]EMS84184.1 beta-ketoacyl-acyl-carrier-protein synthase III [Leptospira noguchii str. Cascata]EMS88126.1 beta-ketoacyl-acyl-carrier-protein synthase I
MSGKNQSGIQITGFGHYLPEKIVTNEEIRSRLKFPEMHPAEKAVIGNIGVNERRRANDSETPMFMASKVAEMALKDAGKKPEEVDLYILANWTDRYYLPDLAPQASKLSGTTNALAFDVSTACTGFVHGVQTASAFLESGKFKNALVIGSERFSVRTRMGGYGEFTAGDAAAGVFLEHTGNTNSGIIDSFLQDEGDLSGIIVTGPPPNSYVKSYPELVTNAADLTLKAMDRLLEKNGLTIDDVDWVVPHPGTDVVVQDVLKRTRFPKEKILMNFERVGNTSAASIPIVLSEYYYKGKFKKGDLFLTPAVGGGFYWGGLLFRL